jgi:hypothetical protein
VLFAQNVIDMQTVVLINVIMVDRIWDMFL